MVALMTESLRLKGTERVLEIGTGSGYQAAILSRLVQHVYTIEIVDELAREARTRLAALGHANVTVKTGTGSLGWPEQAPVDLVVVTAAPEEVPPALVDQLKPGGRLVVPVGRQSDVQELRLVEKDASGRVHTRDITPVRFVPMRR
jgi:protein-L-isoaspartate(D-aspartate) O-methyltransferase